jgi:hypothetical protein
VLKSMPAKRANLLPVAIALGCVIAASGLYLLTGGLRVAVIEVTAPHTSLPEPEYLELRLLYQNAFDDETISCSWTAPASQPFTETLSLEAGDGEVSFRLSGDELPPGNHQIKFLAPWGEILATKVLYLPPRSFEFHPRLTWQPDGLRAEVACRHTLVGDALRAEWFFNGELLPEATSTVVLESSPATIFFHLQPAMGSELPAGRYELALYLDDLFLTRVFAPPA